MSGTRTARLEGDGHYAQLILTLGIALVLQNASQIFFGSSAVSVQTPLSSSAWIIGPLWGDLIDIFRQQGARHRAAVLSVVIIIGTDSARIGSTRLGKALRASADNPTAATVYRHRRRLSPTASPLRSASASPPLPGGCSQPIYPVAALRRTRVRHHHVCRRRARRARQHHRRLLGRHDHRPCAATFDSGIPYQLQNAAIFVVFLAILLFKPEGLFGRAWSEPDLREASLARSSSAIAIVCSDLVRREGFSSTIAYYRLMLTPFPSGRCFGVSWNVCSAAIAGLSRSGMRSSSGSAPISITLAMRFYFDL